MKNPLLHNGRKIIPIKRSFIETKMESLLSQIAAPDTKQT